MSKDKSHNELDNFLKESFKEHTITPAPELWAKIEGKFQPTVVPVHQYARLKLVLYASAIIIAALVALILLSEKPTSENTILTEPLPNEQYSEPIVTNQVTESKSVHIENQDKAPELNAKQNLVENEPASTYVSAADNKSKIKPEQDALNAEAEINAKQDLLQNESTSTDVYVADNKLKTQSEKPVVITEPENCKETITNNKSLTKPLKTSTTDLVETNTDNGLAASMLDVEKKSEAVVSKNITVEKQKEDTSTKASKTKKKTNRSRKYHSSKNNYPKRKNLSDYNRKGKILDDFTFKFNLTPAVTQLRISDEDTQVPDYQPVEMDNPGFTLNVGVEIEYKINDKWAIYSAIKTYYFKQNFEHTEYQISSSFQNNQLLKTSAGTYLVNSDNPTNLPSSVTIDSNLKLRYLDIPFMARYQFRNIYFDGGINYSYLIDNYSSTRAINNSSITFQENGGIKEHAFGFTAGIGYKKTFNSGYRLELGPEIKVNANNIYTGEEAIGMPIFIGLRTVICLSRYYSE